MMAIISSLVKGVSGLVSQPGAWVCQTRGWPRNSRLLFLAQATRASVSVKSYVSFVGWIRFIFIEFAGVTIANSPATIELCFGLLKKIGVSTAVPIFRNAL